MIKEKEFCLYINKNIRKHTIVKEKARHKKLRAKESYIYIRINNHRNYQKQEKFQ